MSKKIFQQLSQQATAQRMCFEWGTATTHISNYQIIMMGKALISNSNVLNTVDLRVDVHKDISNPGWAIANIQVNKGAKDPAAKALLKKGNTGAHKTTHKNVASIRYSQTNYNNVAFQQAIEKTKQADGAVITIEPEEASGSGYVNNEDPSMVSGQQVGEWEYDSTQRMQKYWDGTFWIFYDEAEKKEKYWDGVAWRWKA